MTNAEKYLKDHIIFTEFADNLAEYIVNSGRKITDKHDLKTETLYFLTEERKPTLTEDERVMLRNIAYDSEYKYIYRNLGMLYLSENERLTCVDRLPAMHHLFQFIKEGEEYSIEELLK